MWGFIKSIGSFFTGGSKMADKAAEMIDEAVSTQQERGEGDQADLKDARTSQVMVSGRTNIIDIFVDAVNRLVRPWLTVEICAMMLGYRKVPDITSVSDFWLQMFIIVVTFWFSGRLILKDLPAVIKALRS